MIKIRLAEEVQEFLYNIVSIVVSDQAEQHSFPFTIVVAHNHADDIRFPRVCREDEALLHDIARELVLAVALQTLDHKLKHSLSIGIKAELHYMLCDVVAKGVANQGGHAVVQLCQDCLSCHIFAILKTSLNDSASIGVDTEVLDLASESLEDERYVFGVATFDGLLDDVVSVLVFDASQDILLQFANERSLLIVEYMFESLVKSVEG